jgi:hypothetical protein
MKRFFTSERVQQTLVHCETLGVNTWQSSPVNLEDYTTHRQRGGGLRYISLGRDDPDHPNQLAQCVKAGAIAVAHHGEVTDRLWKAGEIERAHGYCRRVRDAGVLVGVSTHIPEVVDYIISQGWDVDFFMCCVYERHRTREELQALLGHVPIPVKEVYLESDPPRMFSVMRQTERPCLAFKILAAGRLCNKPEWVEAAFRDTFRQIKSNDAVIVGMYPEYEDQVAINAGYVRRFHDLSQS